MNRASVILLCITTLAIFFMLKERPKLDIQRYENRIKSLQKEIDGLEIKNDSLKISEAVLMDKVVEYDLIISNLNNEIESIQNDTKKKLDSVDRYNSLQLQKFFSDRYKGGSN